MKTIRLRSVFFIHSLIENLMLKKFYTFFVEIFKHQIYNINHPLILKLRQSKLMYTYELGSHSVHFLNNFANTLSGLISVPNNRFRSDEELILASSNCPRH